MPLALTSSDLARMKSQVDRAGATVAKYKDRVESVVETGIEAGIGVATGFALGALDRYGRDNPPPGEKTSGYDVMGVPVSLAAGVGAHIASFWLGDKGRLAAKAIGNTSLAVFGYQQGQRFGKDPTTGRYGLLAVSGDSPALADGGARGGTRLSDAELKDVAQGRV